MNYEVCFLFEYDDEYDDYQRFQSYSFISFINFKYYCSIIFYLDVYV